MVRTLIERLLVRHRELISALYQLMGQELLSVLFLTAWSKRLRQSGRKHGLKVFLGE